MDSSSNTVFFFKSIYQVTYPFLPGLYSAATTNQLNIVQFLTRSAMLHWLRTFLIQKVIQIAPGLLMLITYNIFRTVVPSQNGEVYNVYTFH